jgi:hypothetical protein
MADLDPDDRADGRQEAVTPALEPRRGRFVAFLVLGIVLALIVAFVVVLAVRGAGSPAPGSSTGASSPAGPAASPSASPGASKQAGPSPSATAKPLPTAGPGTVASPAPIGQTATPTKGIAVTVAGLKAVQGKASGIGEVSGPAIQFSVDIRNDGSTDLPLDTVVVTVTSGADAVPADELVSVRKAFPASVAAGKTAVGTFTFTLPVSARSDVTISVDYRAGTPVTAFRGVAPR